jgi:hypothetical protein
MDVVNVTLTHLVADKVMQWHKVSPDIAKDLVRLAESGCLRLASGAVERCGTRVTWMSRRRMFGQMQQHRA